MPIPNWWVNTVRSPVLPQFCVLEYHPWLIIKVDNFYFFCSLDTLILLSQVSAFIPYIHHGFWEKKPPYLYMIFIEHPMTCPYISIILIILAFSIDIFDIYVYIYRCIVSLGIKWLDGDTNYHGI